MGTQMDYVGLYIDPRQDKLMTAQVYFDSEQWFEKREETVLFIQRLYRGFRARK
jgi:hypothetical protein